MFWILYINTLNNRINFEKLVHFNRIFTRDKALKGLTRVNTSFTVEFKYKFFSSESHFIFKNVSWNKISNINEEVSELKSVATKSEYRNLWP